MPAQLTGTVGSFSADVSLRAEDIVPRLLTAPDVASAQPWTADDFPAASKEDDSVAAADSVQPAAEQCAASAYDAAQPSAASTSAADPEPMTASAAADSTAHSSTQQIVWPDRPGVVTMQTLQQLTALWKRRRGQQQQAAVGQAGRGEDAAPAADQAAASQSISDSASFAAASCADDGAAGMLRCMSCPICAAHEALLDGMP